MTNDVLIDGRRLTWQEFAGRLLALRDAASRQTVAGYIHAPRACEREAWRLLRHLDLTDRIAIVEPMRNTARTSTPRASDPRRGPVSTALAWLGIEPSAHRDSRCD